MREQNLPANHPTLAVSYNKIGLVYKVVSDYFKALSLYEKASTIYQETLPEHHPHLAIFYNNIGWIYVCLHARALSSAIFPRKIIGFMSEKSSLKSSLSNQFIQKYRLDL